MTPISEIPLATVTSNEANAYERWREGYQNNWQQFFRSHCRALFHLPTALEHRTHRHALIMASRYNPSSPCHRRTDCPGAGDPHTNVLGRLAFAVNNQSQSVQEAGNFVGNMAPGLKANFLSWLGQSVTLYADADPFWSELAAAPTRMCSWNIPWAACGRTVLRSEKFTGGCRLPHRRACVCGPVRPANDGLEKSRIRGPALCSKLSLPKPPWSPSRRKLDGLITRSRRIH